MGFKYYYKAIDLVSLNWRFSLESYVNISKGKMSLHVCVLVVSDHDHGRRECHCDAQRHYNGHDATFCRAGSAKDARWTRAWHVKTRKRRCMMHSDAPYDVLLICATNTTLPHCHRRLRRSTRRFTTPINSCCACAVSFACATIIAFEVRYARQRHMKWRADGILV